MNINNLLNIYQSDRIQLYFEQKEALSKGLEFVFDYPNYSLRKGLLCGFETDEDFHLSNDNVLAKLLMATYNFHFLGDFKNYAPRLDLGFGYKFFIFQEEMEFELSCGDFKSGRFKGFAKDLTSLNHCFEDVSFLNNFNKEKTFSLYLKVLRFDDSREVVENPFRNLDLLAKESIESFYKIISSKLSIRKETSLQIKDSICSLFELDEKLLIEDIKNLSIVDFYNEKTKDLDFVNFIINQHRRAFYLKNTLEIDRRSQMIEDFHSFKKELKNRFEELKKSNLKRNVYDTINSY